MAEDTVTIVTLNAWAGRALYPYAKFVERHSATTALFAFQEMMDAPQELVDKERPGEYIYGDLLNMTRRMLNGDFVMRSTRSASRSGIFQASFMNRRIGLEGVHVHDVYVPAQAVDTGSHVVSVRQMLVTVHALNGRHIAIANVHGLWNGGGKGDCPERLEQSRSIRTALDALGMPWMIVGDLNLDPVTESMRILEEGARNLTKEQGVTCTRTPLYRHYHDPSYGNVADYVIASPGIEVESFDVLPDIASDHAALRTVIR